MKASRRKLAIAGLLLLVPLAAGASYFFLTKGAHVAATKPDRTNYVRFAYRSSGNDAHASDGKSFRRAHVVKTDVLCPETDESWAATLGIGVDTEKQCDYAAVWDAGPNGGGIKDTQELLASNDESPPSHSRFAFGRREESFLFNGAALGELPRAHNSEVSHANGTLQQIADSCVEGVCKSSSTTDIHGNDAAPGGPGKTVSVPEPDMAALLFVGALGLMIVRRMS